MRALLILPLLFTGLITGHRLEMPAVTQPDAVIFRTYYTLQYNEKFEQADWVAYELTRQEVLGTAPRKDQFRSDPDVPTGSAELSDYRKSGYDRGHLAPAADMKISGQAMSESFYMSNMSPQVPGFNRGIWRELEELVRQWALDDEALLVVTGPVFDKESYPLIGENGVAVPEYYFKVLMDIREPELKAIGFILPNKKTSLPLQNFAVSVDRVEYVTGLDFYPLVPNKLEESLEQRVDYSLWFSSVSEEGDSGLYWINSSSGVYHLPGCRYYGSTAQGYYSREKAGEPCSICIDP